MVLNLPMRDTATAVRWPMPAIHSRSAEIAISRPMITAAVSTMIVRRIAADDQHQRDGHDQLVGHRVQKAAQSRGLPESSCQIAIERIGERGRREQQPGKRIGSTGRMPRTVQEQQHDQRNGKNPQPRQDIGYGPDHQAPGCR